MVEVERVRWRKTVSSINDHSMYSKAKIHDMLEHARICEHGLRIYQSYLLSDGQRLGARA